MSEPSSPIPQETTGPELIAQLADRLSEQALPQPIPVLPHTVAPLALLKEEQKPQTLAEPSPEGEAPLPQTSTPEAPPQASAVTQPHLRSLRLHLSTLGLACLSCLGIVWMASRDLSMISAGVAANLDFGPELVQREVSRIGLHNLSDLDPYEQPAHYAVVLKPKNNRQSVALRRYLPHAQLERRQPEGSLLRVESFHTADAATEYNRHLRRLGYNAWVEKRS